MNIANSDNKIINYRDLMIFLIIIITFSLYLFMYNPGILTIESFSQLHQIATGEFTNLHPILHTFIEMLCLKIYSNPLSISIFQVLVFSILWTGICKYNRDDSVKNSDQFIIQFIVTLIICLVPINAIYSITLWSDVLFSYSLLLLCFLIKVIIDKEGQVDMKFVILMALTIAVSSQLSPNGIYLALITLVIITAYLFKNNKNSKLNITLPTATILFILLIACLNVAYNVEDSNSGSIINSPEFVNSDMNFNLNNEKEQYFSTINQTPQSFEDVSSVNIGHSNYKLVNSFASAFKDNIILNTLFSGPILYLILSIILMIFMQHITKSKELYLVYVPILANTLFVLLFTPVQYNRHLYANVLVFYLLIIIFININSNLNLTPNISIKTPSIIGKQIKNKNKSYYEPANELKVNKNEYNDHYEPTYESKENIYENQEKDDEDLPLDVINPILEELDMEEYGESESLEEEMAYEPNIKEHDEIDDLEEEMTHEPTIEEYDEIVDLEEELTYEPTKEESAETENSEEDLVDSILKEIKMEKEN